MYFLIYGVVAVIAQVAGIWALSNAIEDLLKMNIRFFAAWTATWIISMTIVIMSLVKLWWR